MYGRELTDSKQRLGVSVKTNNTQHHPCHPHHLPTVGCQIITAQCGKGPWLRVISHSTSSQFESERHSSHMSDKDAVNTNRDNNSLWTGSKNAKGDISEKWTMTASLHMEHCSPNRLGAVEKGRKQKAYFTKRTM